MRIDFYQNEDCTGYKLYYINSKGKKFNYGIIKIINDKRVAGKKVFHLDLNQLKRDSRKRRMTEII